MKFGKEFRIHLEETLPEWRDKYLRYKPLKKLLKTLPSDPSDDAYGGNPPPPPQLHDFFIGLLNQELEKFNDFYVDQEEDFVILFQELKERIERVREKSGKDGMLTSASEFSKEVMDIRKDFVAIHGQIVLLQNYSSINFAGLVKILKKYDKRTGGLLCIPFRQLALHQPFFATEPLTRLVCECEANLELLFPTKAEVIESAATVQERTRVSSSNVSNVSPNRSLQLGERNVDIYRGTLAAIRVIQGLKRASSTSNPLSLSTLWGNQCNDTGAVTAENSSASDHLASPQSNEESKQEVSHSPK